MKRFGELRNGQKFVFPHDESTFPDSTRDYIAVYVPGPNDDRCRCACLSSGSVFHVNADKPVIPIDAAYRRHAKQRARDIEAVRQGVTPYEYELRDTSPRRHNFGAGLEPAHRHPNGGGWVAETATVHPDAYVGPNVEVAGHVEIGEHERHTGCKFIVGNKRHLRAFKTINDDDQRKVVHS